MMQIKSLEIFVKVLEYGSFSTAAQHLHTVQSNVTNHIKKLETEFGVQLVQRQNPIIPTRAGLQLLNYAEQILRLKREVYLQFAQHQIAADFSLSIGSMESTAAVRLPALLQTLQQTVPALKFSLKTGPSRELIDQVQQAHLDCAFIANSHPIEGLFNLHVWTEKLVLISAKSKTAVMCKAVLQQQKFIAFRQGCSYRRSIELFLTQQDLPTTCIVEMGSLDAIISCVSLDMGVALLPLSYVQQSHYFNQVQIHDIDENIATSKTYLIAAQEQHWSSNMHQFRHFLAQHQLNDALNSKSSALINQDAMPN